MAKSAYRNTKTGQVVVFDHQHARLDASDRWEKLTGKQATDAHKRCRVRRTPAAHVVKPKPPEAEA